MSDDLQLLFGKEEEMQAASDELHICTDDGTKGHHGFVTDVLQKMLQSGEHVDRVVAIGPPIMMRAVTGVTKPFEVQTIVSLNPIMIDGTGMCGGCRVSVGGETRFACVDGPEFDGHKVDFNLLMNRLAVYRDEESSSLKKHECKCEGGK